MAVLSAPPLSPVLATPPVLATNFYTGEFRSDAKMSGPTYDVQDGVCCPVQGLGAPAVCTVQTQQHGLDTYEQGTKERTRSDGPGGSVVTWFGDVMKEMAIVPSNGTTHKYDCAAMCPLERHRTWHPTVMIGGVADPHDNPYSFTKPRHLARPGEFRHPAAAGGKSESLDRWQWLEKIAIIPMAIGTTFVSHATTPAQIFGISRRLLSIKAWENRSFIGFQTEAARNKSLDEFFDIDPETIARCPRAKEGCFTPPPSPPPPPRSDADLEGEVSISTLLARAARDDTRGASSVAAPPSAEVEPTSMNAKLDPKSDPPLPNITFVADWTATIDSLTLTNQNGVEQSNGDLCCSYGAAGSPPICAVNAAKTSGVRYFDVTNQRYRFENPKDPPGAAVVVDYKAHLHMIVGYKNGTTETECKSACPVNPRDVLKPHFFGFHNRVVDKGPVTWHGIPARHYHWVEKADPLPIPLETIDLYADVSDPHNAKPLVQKKALTPFGMKSVGYFNTTWADFKPGPPDPTKFDIKGVATCPKAPNCGKPPMQDERLALGMLHTYAMYAEGREP